MLLEERDWESLDTIYRRLQIIDGLLDMRRRVELQGVWCDVWVLHIRRSQWEPRESLTWTRAEEMVGLSKKGPQSVMITVKEEKRA